MRRLLHRENFVGEIREVRLTSISSVEETDDYRWTEDPDVCGVNALTLGMWAEVLNRWVGPATRVVAVGQTQRKRSDAGTGKRHEAAVPNSLALSAQLKCGGTASYHFSSRATAGPGHSVEIYGSRGALVYRFFIEEVQGASNGSDSLQPIPIPKDEERSQTTDAEFIRAISGGPRVSPDFKEGLHYMEFCEAVAISLKDGVAVTVPPDRPKMKYWGRLLDTPASFAPKAE